MTEYWTLPSPWGGVTSGGRNPASGSVGGAPVPGSMDDKSQVRIPAAESSRTSVLTTRLVLGRRSNVPRNDVEPGGGTSTWEPNRIGPSATVDASTLVMSSVSLTTTSCAGPLAVAAFSKSIRYGIGSELRTKRATPIPAGPTFSFGSCPVIADTMVNASPSWVKSLLHSLNAWP